MITTEELVELTKRDLVLDRASLSDMPQVHAMINEYADRGEMLHRSLAELYEYVRDFTIIREAGVVVACASLHVIWDDLAEIRSVAVKEDLQSHGLGALLVEHCVDEARSLGLSRVFCLTHKPGYYEKLGFNRTEVMSFPRKVWSECIRCPKFSACNEIAMSMDLK